MPFYHCGIQHAFTEYRQPIVIDGEFSHFDRSLRCGNHVFAELNKRAVTVFLHAPWNGQGGYDSRMRHPAGGVIDMAAKDPQLRAHTVCRDSLARSSSQPRWRKTLYVRRG